MRYLGHILEVLGVVAGLDTKERAARRLLRRADRLRVRAGRPRNLAVPERRKRLLEIAEGLEARALLLLREEE